MNAAQFTKDILNLDNNVLFAGVIEKSGHVNMSTSSQRVALEDYLKGRNPELILSQALYAVDLRKTFSSLFGNLSSVVYEYDNMKIFLLPIKDHILIILLDKGTSIDSFTKNLQNHIASVEKLDLYSLL